jgi:hypothetical protein
MIAVWAKSSHSGSHTSATGSDWPERLTELSLLFLTNRVSLSLIERLPCLRMHPNNNPRASLLHFQRSQAAPLTRNDPIADRFQMPSTFLSENRRAAASLFLPGFQTITTSTKSTLLCLPALLNKCDNLTIN